jgi:ubiquinone biosynthesis accessory factor UbiJ
MLTERLQALIDRKVEDSPRARALLAELDGRRMRIVALHIPWQLTLQSSGGKLLPHLADTVEPDVQLAGTPLSLLALVREDPQAVIRRGDVSLTGDAEAGARFQELTQLLRPDLEAALARVIGDVPAFNIGSLLRRAVDYGRSSLDTQARNVGEYLAHERQVLVPRAEARQFLEQVDLLREQTDRLAARVARLESARGGA